MTLAADRLVGTWRVVRLAGEPVTGVELAFATDGSVSGSTGVNRLFGGYTLSDAQLVLGPLATTRMAGTAEAMAVEARLLALLAEPLDVDADGTGLSLGRVSTGLRLEPVPVADVS